MFSKSLLSSLLIVFAFCILTSCSQKSDSVIYGGQNFKAIVADSVVFEWLPEVQLLDYNEKTEELLLLDKTSKEILIINEKGELLSQFNPHVEGPNYVGDYDFGWIFYGDDQLMCYGTYYFHLLDKEGNRIKRFPYPVETNGLWSLDYNPRMLWDYEHNGETNFVAFITAPAGPSYREPDYYDSINMIYSIDVKQEIGNSIMHKPKSSTYRNLEGHVDHGWPYMSNYSGSKFVQVRAVDSMIYVWDAEKDRLINSITIPDEYQPEYDVNPFSSSLEPDRYRINGNVYSTENYFILFSFKLVPESVIRQIRSKHDWYWQSDEYKEAVAKYSDADYLVFDEKGFLGELDFDIGLTGISRVSTKKDFMLWERRYRDERDYRTFLKVKIVPVD